MKKIQKYSGFTLIELSIVVIIIALILAAVLAGGEVIRKAQIRSAASEVEQIRTANEAFSSQYGYYPGDLPDAVSYFGGVTENGNGNGRIWDETGVNEPLRYWQHLSLSGLFKGNYTGVASPVTGILERDVNAPGSNISSSAIWWTAFDEYMYQHYGNAVRLGDIAGTDVPGLPYGPILTSVEMRSLDAKIDDGEPAAGFLWAIRHPGKSDGYGKCVNGYPQTAAKYIDYVLTGPKATELHCAIMLRLDTTLGCVYGNVSYCDPDRTGDP